MIAIIGILAALLLPVLSKAKDRAKGIQCANNMKQLMTAFVLYADANGDVLPPNDTFIAGQYTPCWVAGYMNFDPQNPDNTNAALLTDPKLSVLSPYELAPGIFKCPSDPSTVAGEGNRVRSVSMSQAVGTQFTGGPVPGAWLPGNSPDPNQTNWLTYGRTSSMVRPNPSMLWVFMDEHPDSINDAALAVQCGDTSPDGVFVDIPASLHNGGAAISFADGHTELHHWTGSTIKQPVVENEVLQFFASGDSVTDLNWLQQRTSAPR